ncbi:MAG: AAA family ATPase [Pirellulales bacterium]
MLRDDWRQGNGSPATPRRDRPEAHEEPATEPRIFQGFNAADLVAQYPTERPHIVEGLFRRQEIINLVAAPKMGKSWLAMNLALSVATGRQWLGTFNCNQGRVLLVDNELHHDTLAYRITTVAHQLGIDLGELGDRLTIAPVRGQGVSYVGLGDVLRQFGQRDLVILDAGYRMLGPGQDENSNGDATANYNLLDRYAKEFGTSFVVVLHTSKGGQGDKAITDIGAGAGAQSRAADTHLALVPHDEPNAAVLKVVRRSGRSPDDMVLSRDPDSMRWSRDDELNPDDVKGGAASRAKQTEEVKRRKAEQEETEGLATIKKWWRQHPGQYSERDLRSRDIMAAAQRRLPGLLLTLKGQGYLTSQTVDRKGNATEVYTFHDKPELVDGGRYSGFDSFNEAADFGAGFGTELGTV